MASKQPEKCLGTCGRFIRPHHTTAAQWPGTTRWFGSGMCERCHKRREPQAAKPAFRPCEACGVTTRPKYVAAGTGPEDSRQRIGDLCVTCHGQSEIVTPEQVAQMRAGVIAYLRWRGREIPEELLREAS